MCLYLYCPLPPDGQILEAADCHSLQLHSAALHALSQVGPDVGWKCVLWGRVGGVEGGGPEFASTWFDRRPRQGVTATSPSFLGFGWGRNAGRLRDADGTELCYGIAPQGY